MKFYKHVLFGPIILLSLIIIISGVGIYALFQIDSAIDYSILSKQIHTNQTFVDEQSCEKIQLSINLLHQTFSPTQQDEIQTLIEDFEMIKETKRCP